MKKSLISFNILLSFLMPAYALDIGDISSFMYSDSAVISKEIKNSTDTGRLINIKVERITNPLEGGSIIPMESKNELLLTPGSLLLPANSNETIRFFYNGPNDDKERYYRILWADQSLSEGKMSNAKRHAIATASALISSILVVSPRKAKYDYKYSAGKITNPGNATLRVIAYGPCLRPTDGVSCKENYFLMPGKSRTFTRVNVAHKNGRVAFWQENHFVSVK
ncbi:hypothetical protein PU683_16450 [Kosakonia cowanii]|uniref:EcpB family pilus assembly chaperone n=1 Tax=Kosakonia cowanii TaxID=208223 RepID=UPI0023F823D6|nr:hypothetical protein [Kosakonia cowanii]MDF7761111.1 hypothetical protein [Kosakonia cowanii]